MGCPDQVFAPRRLPPDADEIVRMVSGRRDLEVRLGRRNCFREADARIEIARSTTWWPAEQQRALLAHEAAHARLTHYPEQAPIGSDFAWLNLLEDARIDRWVARRFPGLSAGLPALVARCVGQGSTSRATELARAVRTYAGGLTGLVVFDPDTGVGARRLAAELVAFASGLPDDPARGRDTWAASAEFVRWALGPALEVRRRLLNCGDHG